MTGLERLIRKKPYQDLTDYAIGVCTPPDIDGVTTFLKDHWSANHPFVVSRALMDWQYYDEISQCYNIIIAKHKKDGEIHGIYAFIPVSQFDPSLAPHKDIWLSIWKVRADIVAPLLGISLLSYLIDTIQPRALIGIKSSAIAKALFASLGEFRTGMLNHFYMVNQEKSRFELLDNFDGVYESGAPSDANKKLEELNITDLDEPGARSLFDPKRVPTKSIEYTTNRFLKHPVYAYKILKIVASGVLVGLLVTRVQEYGGQRAIRVVDYFGDEEELGGLSREFQRLLTAHDCEYLDFYNHGFHEQTMPKAGFLQRKPGSKIIIPNYFNPFEKENVDIDYVVRAEAEVVICKADADQDRPNSLP